MNTVQTKPTAILPDLLQSGLDIVFCGSAASTVSAQKKSYYAGPGNKFWVILFQVGLTPHQFTPEEYEDLLLYKIGLTDMAKFVSGNDKSLRADSDKPDVLYQKIKRFQPKILAFVGKRAAKVFFKEKFGFTEMSYGIQNQCIDLTKLFVLPSPSGLARRYWDLVPWKMLAKRVQK